MSDNAQSHKRTNSDTLSTDANSKSIPRLFMIRSSHSTEMLHGTKKDKSLEEMSDFLPKKRESVFLSIDEINDRHKLNSDLNKLHHANQLQQQQLQKPQSNSRKNSKELVKKPSQSPLAKIQKKLSLNFNNDQSMSFRSTIDSSETSLTSAVSHSTSSKENSFVKVNDKLLNRGIQTEIAFNNDDSFNNTNLSSSLNSSRVASSSLLEPNSVNPASNGSNVNAGTKKANKK